ncbi:type II toxin-antitoxin system RelE/ParE family toxin [Limosilactobacillus reuteri]|uniref:type II toxin-antitoxin system RelE/ParE family toxin n=1 Tax=Limosilactobacillus reuteri TaxID=1598 RepID=UPI003863C5FC
MFHTNDYTIIHVSHIRPSGVKKGGQFITFLKERVSLPLFKKLKGYRHQLWELRPMPERVFYGVWKKNNFVLLNHYAKKKDETDPRQIERALSLLDDWYERKGK